MALQVWFPLNGNFENQGLSNVTVTSVGGSASYNVSGKTGSCLSCNGSTYWTISPITIGSEASICYWAKCTDSNAMYWVLNASVYAYLNFWQYNNKYYLNTGDSLNNPFQDNGTDVAAIMDGLWHHFLITFNGTNCLLYIDGAYYAKAKTYKSPATPSNSNIRLAGGFSNGHTYDMNGYMNDFRVYNHCLSAKEIREISKALVLHYKLDNLNGNVGNVNLIANGWGGTDNWSLKTSSYVSTSVPNVSGITNSYINGTQTLQYIPLDSTHTYTMSGYVKRPSTANTYCYLALVPYDIDKNRIYYYTCSIGFKSNSLTTMTQDLNSGDTVIHLASVNGWSNPSQYYYLVAIFGYKNSFGYTYPDLVYTRRIYAYGTTTDKSNIDLENKTVTLRSPYSGEKIPSGTSICLTSIGSTYYYPATYYATDSDWHLISSSFKPSTNSYLKAAAYVQVYAMSQNYAAGLTLVDSSVEPIVYDCSGYGNDGTITGSLFVENNSPRYNSNIVLTGTQCITVNSPSIEAKTMTAWVKTTKNKNTSQFAVADKLSQLCITFYNGNIIGYYGPGGSQSTGSRCTLNNSSYVENGWNHFAVVKTGVGTRDIYCNGTKLSPNGTDYWSTTADVFIVGARNVSFSLPFYGGISDVRLYADALSESEILDLYQTSAFIDNLGNLHSLQFTEQSPNILQIENLNEFATSTSYYTAYTTRNGVKAFPVRPNWYASPYTTMIGKFKENTQYLFDVWIDTDDVVSQNVNRPGGFYIYYTDGSTATACIKTGNSSSPIGWQHILVITPVGKTVSSIGIYYYTSTAFYVRADSFITELKNTNIYKNGITETGQFIENTDVAFIGTADFNANRINEI